MSSPWVLFVSPACPLCAEAEAIIDAQNIKFGYKKRRVLRSARPGFVVVEAEPEPIEAPAETIPGTPALWNRETNVLLVGLEAIESALLADSQQPRG